MGGDNDGRSQKGCEGRSRNVRHVTGDMLMKPEGGVALCLACFWIEGCRWVGIIMEGRRRVLKGATCPPDCQMIPQKLRYVPHLKFAMIS